MADEPVEDAVAPEPRPAELEMRAAIVKAVVVSVPLAIAFFVGLVTLAVRNQHPNWAGWLSMATGLGVLAGVFFGMLVGFIRASHLFE